MSGVRRWGLVAVAAVALAVGPASAGPAAVGHGSVSAAQPASLGQSDFDADAVRLEVRLRPDAPTRLYVQYRFQLDGEDGNRTRAFESIREEVESDPGPYRERFRTLLAPAVRRAQNTTGREMALRNVTVSAGRRVAGDVGYVAYTVEWRNFATVRDGRIRAGDALSGLYLDERSRLFVSWPGSYRLSAVSPEPHDTRERAVVWRGPLEFASSEPRVSLAPAGGAAGLLDRVPLLPATALGLGVLAAAGGLALVVRRRREAPGAMAPTTDPELMSNEERLLHTLEEGGGRLRQQELADALEWTDPKTSRVVNSLREDDAIEVFRLGRENVVSLPDYDDRN